MTATSHSAPSRAQKWLIAFALLVGAFIVTGVLGAIGGSLAWIVPVASVGVVIYAFINPAWSVLGFASSGIKKIFGVIAFISLIGAATVSGEAMRKQQLEAAQRIVEAGRTDPKAQAALLSSADDGTLDALKGIAPSLETGERNKRAAKDAASKAAREAVAVEQAKRLEAANKDKIAANAAKEKQLDRDDLDARIAAYEELTVLAPGRTEFQEQLTALKAKRDRQAEVREHPEKGVELVDFTWNKGGFGSIMLLDATIKNTATVPLKDFTVKCVHSAPSGTVIDSNTETVYERIAPGKSRRFREISMGFIKSQASHSSCEITDAKVDG